MLELIVIIIFSILILIKTFRTRLYRTPVFFMILLSYIVIYLLPSVRYQDLGIEHSSLLKFYLLYTISLYFLIVGFTRKNRDLYKKLQKVKINEKKTYFHLLIIALVLRGVIAIAIISGFSNINIIKALIFIMEDISTIFFYGYLYVYFKSGNKLHFLKKSFVIVLLFSVFFLKDIINLVNGNEFSRFNLLLVILILFLLLLESTKEKLLLSILAITTGVIIILNFTIINKGDLLILKYATDVLFGLESNITVFKPFLTLYSFGFYMLPDFFGLKPEYYTANGQFLLDILGFTKYQVENYPFGVGITGVVDAFWNWGFFGVIIFFYFAGYYLKILRSNAIKFNSSFLYGIYIYQVSKLFLLFRLDLSFYFGRLIIILPILYYITRRVAANGSKIYKLK